MPDATEDRLAAGTLRVLETALNRVLALDPDTPRRLRPLAGRSLGVALTEPPLRLRVRFTDHALQLAHEPEDAAPPDATVEATLGALAGLALSRGERTREVGFRGDVGVIQEVRRLFGELDVDLEEQLAAVTGDVMAHQVGNAVRGGRDWGRHAADTLLRNTGEWLTEERRLLPPAAEARHFLAEVDRLREDTDRLEARLRRLERRHGEGS